MLLLEVETLFEEQSGEEVLCVEDKTMTSGSGLLAGAETPVCPVSPADASHPAGAISPPGAKIPPGAAGSAGAVTSARASDFAGAVTPAGALTPADEFRQPASNPENAL